MAGDAAPLAACRAQPLLGTARATQLHHKHNVDDATYKAAVSKFGEQGVVDLIAVNGYYDLVSMTLNVAQVRPPESEKVPIAQK